MADMRIRYKTIEFGELDIHLCVLRDNQQYDDVDGIAESLGIGESIWPLFGQIWPSAKVLAHLMLEFDIAGKRILEVGCGMGLASLVLNHRHADITATDYHPDVERFLKHNVELNTGRQIPFVRTGWEDHDVSLGKFDLIIGSDILYQPDHAELLSGFIDRHAQAQCHVVIVDPGRGRHSGFSKKMQQRGYLHSQSKPSNADYFLQPFKGQVLNYHRGMFAPVEPQKI